MGIALIAFCILLPTNGLAESWTPPENPDPQAILNEARADRQRGRYEVALSKHLWYHENALKLQPAQSGVRLSFALGHWLVLGESYPPALAKMKEVRDDTEKRIRDEDRVRVKFTDFHDFVSFNRYLREDQRTLEAFQWLDETDEKDAKVVFHIVQRALTKNKSYELYGKYIELERDLARIGASYKAGIARGDARFGEQFRGATEKTFLNSATTLVAILVQTDRKAEAEEAAEKVKTFVTDAELQEKLNSQLESALKGTVPNPWP